METNGAKLNLFKLYRWLAPALIGVAIALVVVLYNALKPEDVLAVKLEKEDVVATLTVTGEVQAHHTVNVSSPVGARILSMSVDDGDPVHAGQLIAELDREDVSARVSEAQARASEASAALRFLTQGTRREELGRLELAHEEALARARDAKRYAERLAPLYKDGAVSANEYDEATTRLEVAEKAAAQAQQQLEAGKTGPTPPEIQQARAAAGAAAQGARAVRAQLQDYLVTSNINGIVLKRIKEPGETVTPGEPLIKIADRNTLEIIAFVEEPDLSRVELNDQVFVVLDSMPAKPLEGRITRIGSEVNPANGTVEVTVKLLPEVLKTVRLLPGMTADVNIITDHLRNAMVLPATSVLQDNGKTVAYRFSMFKLQPVEVKTRRISLENVEVIKGLKPGDTVARAAEAKLLQKRWVNPTFGEPLKKKKGMSKLY